MTRSVAAYLDAHCSTGDAGVFRRAADLAAGPSGEAYSVSSGRELLDLASCLAITTGPPIDHLTIAGHGGSTWLLDDKHGVTTRSPRHHDQVSVTDLVDAWSPRLTREPLISLAACMCSRSPRWYLRWRWAEAVGSDWGRRAYLPGGQTSLAARIRDELHWHRHGHYARVRGHRAAGHATALSLVAEHWGCAGVACRSLFRIALPDVKPTIRVRRRWVRLITGELARRWLLGDDRVVEEIRRRWAG